MCTGCRGSTVKLTASTPSKLTLGRSLVPGLGRDCVNTDACQDHQANETVCCTGDIDMTSGSHGGGCAPETHRALESSRHMTSPHTYTPEHSQQSAMMIKDCMKII